MIASFRNHKIELQTVDVLEHDQPVTYKRAACSCGWKGETTYITFQANDEGMEHLRELIFKDA